MTPAAPVRGRPVVSEQVYSYYEQDSVPVQSASPGMPDPVRPHARHPLRTFAVSMGAAFVVLVAVVSSVATGRAPDPAYLRHLLAVRSDSDSVATDRAALDALRADTTLLADSLARPDSLRADSLALADSLPLDSLLADSLTRPDSLADSLADSLLADSLALPDTGLAPRYLPGWNRDRWTAAPLQRRTRPLSPRLGNYWRHEILLDSTRQVYVARERVADEDVRYPLEMDLSTYRRVRLDEDMEAAWYELAEQRALQRANRSRGGFGFNIVVPGGQQSAFTTIFGKPEVDLRVNGQADIRAGFDYRKSDLQASITGRDSQIDPDFKQDLRLGITGRIGDKLSVDVNWDTNNQFDYQNQLKLVYRGYEDEIIQNIEAGNVFLNTPSRLIRGGQSLFGIKSELQMGGLRLTTVASQQEGQANSLAIEGGAESTPFDLKPTDYVEAKHYFLSFYFRNRWEDALQSPPNILLANGFQRITDLEVWVQDSSPNTDDANVRQGVAMVDLGEPSVILTSPSTYTEERLPDVDRDQYDNSFVSTWLRPGAQSPTNALKERGLGDDDYAQGRFRRLAPTEYEFDEALGYLSLNTSINESAALAVAFRYVADGRTVTVGDFSTETGGSTGAQDEDRLVLKLLRPNGLRAPSATSDPAAWYLEMRNIYSLPGSRLNPADFDLQVYYEPPGKTPTKTVRDLGAQQTLLQMLGLDRLNADGNATPDDRFDYLINYTINPARGRIIFPYLEPFGSHIARLIDPDGSNTPEEQAKKDLYVFSNLYRQKKENARLDNQHNVYRIRGSYKGGVADFYDLRAYAGLIPGSVTVTSGGSRLAEGVDYVVDYSGGTVQIINPAHLASGRDIAITYEQNSFFNLQKKTLLGARADYDFGDRLDLGATLMRLNQKSPIDKFRIGEEPISNTIWGFDGQINLQPRWLTRAIDWLPLIQTKAPSSIQVTGEFAQLLPGTSETIAFSRTRRGMRENGRDFKADELEGISYLDDFEGFENTFSLKQPGAWRLSSAPARPDPADPGQLELNDPVNRSYQRATAAWYQLNATMINELCSATAGCNPRALPPAVSLVRTQEVYPEKQTEEANDNIQTFDLYFDPRARGPYNYNNDLRGFLDRPKEAWGGLMQRLPDGYRDFSTKNIESLEFIIKPIADNAENDAGRGAMLYIDLGSISEDVIPDNRPNTEDGLAMKDISEGDVSDWARQPRGTQNNIIDVDNSVNRTEDVGLDGLVSYDTYGGLQSNYPAEVLEHTVFADFLTAIDQDSNDPRYRAEVAKAMADPSGDDYHFFQDDAFFGNAAFFPEGASMQDRLTRWFPSTELNSYEAQNQLAPAEYTSVKRGNSRSPDTEDLNLNSAVDLSNNYFQYELPLSRAVLDSLANPALVDDFVVTRIEGSNGWYSIRVPFVKYDRKTAGIDDFSLIETIRMWTTGHEVPFTLRFATLELVGSQWQKAEQVALERELESEGLINDTRLSIESINNEENRGTYRIPPGTIISQIRSATSGTSIDAREQAMVLKVENLMPGKQRAVYRTQAQGLDLSRYRNLRMFAHLDGVLASGQRLEDLPPEIGREKVRLFVRLGANETNDYYEYEMPLVPSDPQSGDQDRLWMTYQDVGGQTIDLNSVNLVLETLNQLKVARGGFPADSVYWSNEHNAPLDPALNEFAPPGTRIGIKGNPSLARVNSIVIGVRNAADSLAGASKNRNAADIIELANVWVNELRVSGYDQSNGRAALANADIRLADLASVKASFQWQEDGFGSLSSTLAEREQNDLLNWGVTADLNVHKFIPERFGWTIPVSVQVQRNASTPRFSPQNGDIRLEALLAQVDADETLSPAERDVQKDRILEAAQTNTLSRSFTTRLSKSGSHSRLLRNTLDGISLNYTWSDNSSRTPTQQLNESWRWSTTFGYRLNIRRPRTVRPFWFLEEIPIVGTLGDLHFNYLPQGLSFSASANRNFSETRDRPRTLDEELELPALVQYPIRPQHTLAHRRNFSLQYNPFTFLNLTFDTNTNQSLNALGADTLFTVIETDADGTELYHIPFGSGDDARAKLQAIQADTTAGHLGYLVRRLDVKSSQEVVNRIFSGHPGLRTENYDMRFSGTFRPNLNQTKALNWINLQDVVYNVQFGWQNGAVSSNLGADVNTQVEVRGGVTFRPQDFWRKFDFYKNLEKAQRDAEAKAAAEQRTREQERQRRRTERQQQREEEQRRREEEERRRAAGEAPEAAVPADSLAADEAPDEAPDEAAPPAPAQAGQEEEEDGGFKLPLPNFKSLLRQTILAVTGVRDFAITYNGTFSSRSSNVGLPHGYVGGRPSDVDVRYTLLDAFRGRGPSLGYRFGLERRIPLFDDDGSLDNRVLSSSIQVTDQLRDGHRFQARTALNPTQALQINLNWNTDWDESESFTYRPIFNEQQTAITGVETALTASGNNRSSVWAFGASYTELFKRQLATFRSDSAAFAGQPADALGDADRNGRVVLTGESVIEDFQSAFMRGLGTFDARGLLPIPMPGWQVSYSGMSKWPILNRLVQNATLRHGYSADYSTNYQQNPLSADTTRTFNLSGRQIEYTVPDYEVGGLRVNERYQPFIGVDLTWKGRFQTNIAWNRSNAYSVSTSTFAIGENKTSEVSFTGTFQQQGMRLPFLRNRLNNRISFSLTVAHATISDKQYYLRNALNDSGPKGLTLDDILTNEQYVKRLTESSRLSVTPQINYQFSNRVSANFSLKYENFVSQDSRTPSSTTINGGFNIRVSIAN